MDMLFGTFASKSLLIVRVVLGVIFFGHGAQKTFGWFGGPGLRGVISSFRQSLGIPAPFTVLAAFTECFGGLAMIVGVLVRPTAVGLVLVMVVAIATVHWRNGFFLNWSLEPGKGHGFEMNFALIGMALAVLIGGAGFLSIDRMIRPW
ncbi:MAG: DoxX family protein [Candidatus Rokubacteria bacterium]|nr:DoxX family protein [Candidatus Rokubacteria bacterium]